MRIFFCKRFSSFFKIWGSRETILIKMVNLKHTTVWRLGFYFALCGFESTPDHSKLVIVYCLLSWNNSLLDVILPTVFIVEAGCHLLLDEEILVEDLLCAFFLKCETESHHFFWHWSWYILETKSLWLQDKRERGIFRLDAIQWGLCQVLGKDLLKHSST